MMLVQTAALPVRRWLGPGLPPDDPDEQDELKAVAGDTARLRVLIVEDEFFISLETDFLLKELGHTPVGVAVSAEEAVAMAERHRPDVVLMDIRLSGARDGIYAAEAILSRFDIPSIFVTTNTDPHTRQRALAVGGLGFIEKPVTKERLVAGLKAAVR